ncbi:MAG: ABC transporter permease [Bacteroidales bacterium]|nr:ABC transporter permease [Bacteroidales bacterium]
MHVPTFIAFRYLFSKKNINVINIIARISTLAVAVATAALIIILSVFNGLESIIVERFNSFHPELKISLKDGKYFEIKDLDSKLKQINAIDKYSFTFEDFSAVKYDKVTHPFIVKGVEDNYKEIVGIDSMMFDGDFILKNTNEFKTVVGYEVAKKLSIGLGFITPIVFYAPKRFSKGMLNPSNAFNKRYLYPSGVFAIDESADQFIITDLSFAQELFQAEGMATNVEIKLKKNENLDKIKSEISDILGSRFEVKDRIEQNAFFKILNSERLIIYLILGFVLLIAAFNIVATLSMLMVEKKGDFITLKSMGFSSKQIQEIFIINGWLTSFIGGIIGLFLGAILSYLQIKFAWISFGDGNYDISAYPVELRAIDFVWVILLVAFIGFVTSFLPIQYFKRRFFEEV